MRNISQYLPFLIPIAVLELGLMLGALISLIRHKKTRNLNVIAWGVIIVVFELLGPIAYFLFGREED